MWCFQREDVIIGWRYVILKAMGFMWAGRGYELVNQVIERIMYGWNHQ